MSAAEAEVRAVELGVNADEERLGIVEVTAIAYKRMTIIVLETDDGLMIGGVTVRRADVACDSHVELGRAIARTKARERLVRLRQNYQARQAFAAQAADRHARRTRFDPQTSLSARSRATWRSSARIRTWMGCASWRSSSHPQ